MISFVDDDPGYLAWVAGNPEGFVVNCLRPTTPDYLILHRATCGSIRSARRGNWTTGDYMKVCGLDLAELHRWAEDEIGGPLKSCELCKPLADRPGRRRWPEGSPGVDRRKPSWPQIKTAVEFTAALFAVLGGIVAIVQWLL